MHFPVTAGEARKKENMLSYHEAQKSIYVHLWRLLLHFRPKLDVLKTSYCTFFKQYCIFFGI